MRAVLYISHGSRVKAGVNQARAFIESCITRLPIAIQEVCYLELTDPDIPAGVERCIVQGATEIIIQPVLLLAAGHVKQDIPDEIQRMSRKYPDVHFIYSQPFGCDSKIIDILSQRLHEKGSPNLEQDSILLVGRGSSDPEIKGIFKEIEQALSEKVRLPVSTCFLAACEPRFNKGLDSMGRSWYRHIFVVPYLMFTGVLMNEMKDEIEKRNQDSQQFILCDSLGHHENLIQVLVERVSASLGIETESLI